MSFVLPWNNFYTFPWNDGRLSSEPLPLSEFVKRNFAMFNNILLFSITKIYSRINLKMLEIYQPSNLGNGRAHLSYSLKIWHDIDGLHKNCAHHSEEGFCSALCYYCILLCVQFLSHFSLKKKSNFHDKIRNP